MMTMGRRSSDVDRDPVDGRAETALMLGYCRGEREAFESLYSRVAPAIFTELLASTGDRRRAEDLLDRTFRLLHESRSCYVEGADPRSWISQMARRALVLDDRRRSAGGRGRVWSSIRAAFTRTSPMGVEARS